jgi:hypothetical protein
MKYKVYYYYPTKIINTILVFLKIKYRLVAYINPTTFELEYVKFKKWNEDN